MNGTGEGQGRDKPGFDAVIPASVRYDKALRPNAKLLYGEIRAMASREGYCWASNRYFAQLYGLTEKTISELIRDLAREGHIWTEVLRQADTNQVAQRRIWVSQERYERQTREEEPMEALSPAPPKKPGRSPEKSEEPPRKNREAFDRKKKTRENIPPLPPKGQGKEGFSPEAALEQANLPQPAKQAMLEWLAYKRERRESYKPQGLKALFSRAQDCAGRYGGQAVADAIQDSMASNYQGVAWDKLRRRQASPPPRDRQEVEEW